MFSLTNLLISLSIIIPVDIFRFQLSKVRFGSINQDPFKHRVIDFWNSLPDFLGDPTPQAVLGNKLDFYE